jgi:hypothetical protein
LLHDVNQLSATDSQRHFVPITQLSRATRWSAMALPNNLIGDEELTLGAIANVHRGQVTGANDFFVMTRARARELGISKWCMAAITRAEEIINANGIVKDSSDRKVLLNIPADVDRRRNPALDSYLRSGERSVNGAQPICERYICSHRQPWFRVKPSCPPVVVSYMARQAPVFALNPDGLALLNIGHGIVPRRRLNAAELRRFVHNLNKLRPDFVGRGRTYHGGLEKFEPGEMERLPLSSDEFPW